MPAANFAQAFVLPFPFISSGLPVLATLPREVKSGNPLLRRVRRISGLIRSADSTD